MKAWTQRLFEPVDIASLAVFRICFGGLMAVEVYRYFSHGWIASYYLRPRFHFTYWGFGWIQPWPGDGMYWHFGLLAVLALCICAGVFYRVTAPLFCLGITYVFLLEQSTYLNHIYLVCILSFLMSWVPANRALSVDARQGFTRRSETIPRWSLLLIQGQLALVYTFGAIAKMDGDWLSGVPGQMFLSTWEVTEGIAHHNLAGKALAISGLLFDLLIAPSLFWKRTRPFAVAAALFFHLTNSQLFQIGIFPWMMIAATPLFFSPSWPRRFLKPAQGQGSKKKQKRRALEETPPAEPPRRLVLTLLGLWFSLQILIPLRHWLYPYEVNWAEEGHNFSWHMKLRNKSGDVWMFVVDPAAGGKEEPVPLGAYLTDRQIQKMSTRPDMMQVFAIWLGKELEEQRGHPVEIRVDARVSLNGRPPMPLIDPRMDLAHQPRGPAHSKFILPLPELPPRFGHEGAEE